MFASDFMLSSACSTFTQCHSSLRTLPFSESELYPPLQTTAMPETRNIVFLGASYAGLSASHFFLKHVHPHLPQDGKITYKVILVDVSSKTVLRTASPRAVVDPGQIPAGKAFLDIEPGYKQYGDKFQFVQGKAIA